MKFRLRTLIAGLAAGVSSFGAWFVENALATERYKFAGYFATGVTPEAITPELHMLNCVLVPSFVDGKGIGRALKLDLPHFRKSGLFRYRLSEPLRAYIYYEERKVIVGKPLGKFDGNPYYAPKVSYQLVKSHSDDENTYLGFRNVRDLGYAIRTGDEKKGNRGASVRCPFKESSYEKLTQSDSSLPALTEDERAENINILWALRPNPRLVEDILAAKWQLE